MAGRSRYSFLPAFKRIASDKALKKKLASATMRVLNSLITIGLDSERRKLRLSPYLIESLEKVWKAAVQSGLKEGALSDPIIEPTKEVLRHWSEEVDDSNLRIKLPEILS